MFITFDGPHGVGKTTIVDGVVAKMRDLGMDVVLTKEPTKSALGDFLRRSEEFLFGNSLACIAAADRYFHIDSEIMPALQKGKVVVSDRYVESSLALQRLDGCTLEFVWGLNSKVLVPDLCVVVTAHPTTIAVRLLKRGAELSRFEREKSKQMELGFYLEAAEFLSLHGFNVFVLENDGLSIEELVGQVVERILQLGK